MPRMWASRPESSPPLATAPPYRGRFAPSPTGPLHLGSLLAALGSWLMARQAGGQWLLRIEDIDPPRERRGMAARHIRDLARFGFDPDGPVEFQSRRSDVYAHALDHLRDGGWAFPCRCSRSDLAAMGGVHHACVPNPSGHAAAWRVRLPPGDDAAQGITEVVRGADLLDSTARQIALQRLLGAPTPGYAHLPVVREAGGAKLSKSLAALPVDPADPLPPLRAAFRMLGQDAAVLDGPMTARRALERALAHFEPVRVPDHDAVPAAPH